MVLVSPVLKGATCPPAISRSDASPEADTTSYSPVFIRLTASSEVPKYFTFALQPVWSSNGLTQFTFGSFEPSSAYPGQARMFTSPSPLPSDFCIAMSGGVNAWPTAADPPLPLPPLLPPLPPPELLVPHAASASPRISAPADAVTLRAFMWSSSVL